MQKKVIHLESVDSTNLYTKRLAERGEGEGVVVLADRQTAGRGRLGRSFFSPSGGLYMSILLRPQNKAFDALLITAAAAVAVSRAIERLTPKKCLIKWVNDIYCDKKKVCGILAEGAFLSGTDTLSYAVLGLGINISDPEGGFPSDIKNRAGSLFGKESVPEGFKERLSEAVTEEFFALYNALPDKTFIEEYRRRSLLLGKEIYYIRAGEKFYARVLDIDDNGHLLVEQNGKKITIGTGEVTVREKENAE